MFNRQIDSWSHGKRESNLLPLANAVNRTTPLTVVELLVKDHAVWHTAGKDHRIEVLPWAGRNDLMKVVSNNYHAALGSPRMRGFCLSSDRAK